ncbi:MAG: histidine kinase [Eubacteriales bacterium]|nr:histidine kinase [Eubacteriales bacterium]
MQNKIFQNQLLKGFLFYTLIPSILISGILILGIFVIGNRQIRFDMRRLSTEIRSVLEAQMAGMRQAAYRLSEEVDIERLAVDKNYSAQVVSAIYQQLNVLDLHCEAYVFDFEGNQLFSTEVNLATQDYVSKSCPRLFATQNMRTKEYILFGQSYVYQDIPAQYIVSGLGSQKAGGILIACSNSSIETMIKRSSSVDALIVNAYDRVFVSTSSLLQRDPLNLDTALMGVRLNEAQHFRSGENKRFVVLASPIARTELSLLLVYDYTTYYYVLLYVIVFSLLCFLTIACGSIFSAKKFSRRQAKDINTIITSFKQYKDGNERVRLDLKTNNDLMQIVETFNQIVEHIEELNRNQQDYLEETNTAKLNALTAQINPHFLFNTLEGIRFAITIDPDSAKQMILNLSSMLRYVIDFKSNRVCLEAEIAFIHAYIALMKRKYGEKLSYEEELSDEILKLKVPRMLVQPLIENSIKYARPDAQIELHLKGYRSSSQLVLWVRDNGPGIEPERLNELKANLKLSKRSNDSGRSIGIENIYRRLLLMYGKKNFKFDIRSGGEEGTEISIRINCSCLK